jgi:hypothetical protein
VQPDNGGAAAGKTLFCRNLVHAWSEFERSAFAQRLHAVETGNAGRTTAGGKGMMENVEERIRKRAYEIWESEGCPHGREAEHWRQAAEEVAAKPTTGFAVSDEAGPAPDAAIAGATKPATRRRTAGGTKEPTAAATTAKPGAGTGAKAAGGNTVSASASPASNAMGNTSTSTTSTSTTGEPAAKPKGTRGRRKTE